MSLPRNVRWQEHHDRRRGFDDQYFEEPAQPSGARLTDEPERVHLRCPHDGQVAACLTCGYPQAVHRCEVVLFPEQGVIYRCERHAVALVRVAP